MVSVADLEPNKEWMVSKPIKADIEFHKGELSFEEIAGMISISSLVYSSPGFAVVAAKAIGTPVICVFGGYENSASFLMGDTPYLGIDPIRSCQCFSHKHACQKQINIDLAIKSAERFLNDYVANR